LIKSKFHILTTQHRKPEVSSVFNNFTVEDTIHQ
jgi:hypothetical protein